MVEINKYKFDKYYAFDITTDEGCFSIVFGGNLDLYWSYRYKECFLDTHDSKEFFITKENYFLYSLFDELYNDVKDYNIFTIDMFDKAEDWVESKNNFLE